MKERCRVAPEQLKRVWAPETLGIRSTEELPPLEGLVGQERAVEALLFGLEMKAPGYNIFVAGPPGTGKTSYTRNLVGRRAGEQAPGEDWVYVHNFDRPDEPRALALPTGQGPAFAKDVGELAADAWGAIARTLESREHEERRERVVAAVRSHMAEVAVSLQETARRQGFLVSQTEQGFMAVPLVKGQPLSPENEAELTETERQAITARAAPVREAIAGASRQLYELEKAVRDRIRQLDQEAAMAALTPMLDRVRSRYGGQEGVLAYLERAGLELLEHLEAMKGGGEAEGPPTLIPGLRLRWPDPRARLKVNIFVTRDGERGAPVVLEPHPSYTNLFGKVDYTASDGFDITQIKSGAVHRANGGYLILNALDVLQSPFAWDALKRALLGSEARIEAAGQELRLVPVETVRPEPIPLQVKVILIGSPYVYQMLHQADEAFRKLFKLAAEFDVAMPATPANVQGFAGFLAHLVRRDGLLPLDAGAIARVLEYSQRLSEDQAKLSARFNDLVEAVYEAHAWAKREAAASIGAGHVDRAIEHKRERRGLAHDQALEMITRDVILVDVQGGVVGQVNALTVMTTGDTRFGAPSRITARVFMGGDGISHIEREIHLSGKIHDKGLLTLQGFLGDRFARRRPLIFSASIAFEQTYGPVDGDSASSTELYALLSALAELPIDQGIAVTGSVNQRGQVQPIGGINEKIEGFYRVCAAKGLTGKQGVMMPRANLANLALSEEVIAAVRAGRFGIWAVATIEEGIEILTGLAAGEPLPEGGWTPGSVFDRVDRRLEQLAHAYAAFGKQSQTS